MLLPWIKSNLLFVRLILDLCHKIFHQLNWYLMKDCHFFLWYILLQVGVCYLALLLDWHLFTPSHLILATRYCFRSPIHSEYVLRETFQIVWRLWEFDTLTFSVVQACQRCHLLIFSHLVNLFLYIFSQPGASTSPLVLLFHTMIVFMPRCI